MAVKHSFSDISGVFYRIKTYSMMSNPYIIMLLLMSYYAGAQQKFTLPDSLAGKGYGYLESRASIQTSGKTASVIYAKSWLYKSKAEKDYSQMALAYKAMLYNADAEFHMAYADSMITAAGHTGDNALLGSAYMTKGVVCYERKQIRKALDNYLLADEYVSHTNDQYLIHKVKYGIGLTKYYVGFYDEAIALFTECIDYFEEENDRAYLNSLHMLGLCYNRTKHYERSSQVNRLGIAVGRKLQAPEMEPYFIHSEGVNKFFHKDYDEAIRMLLKVIPAMGRNRDFANESIANFYIAKSYWELGQKAIAIGYLKKVDDAFSKESYIRPDLRESYELLIDYYKDSDDKNAQLLYINKLLKVDSVLGSNYRYLLSKVFKQYDTRKLLSAKAGIEKSLRMRKITDAVVIFLLLVCIGYLVYRHFANRKLYRMKYEELMNRGPQALPALVIAEKDSEPGMSGDVEKTLLKNLEKFEVNKRFLEKDMNLVKLSELLHTNTKYVTKIIQRHRGKGTIEYISDLKIDHVVELLKTQNRYRNYTNKALGEEAGFGSTQNFTRAFKARNVISPTYFIAELKKDCAG